MDKTYNLYNLEASFKKYLLAGNVNQITIRNYLSDYRYFCGWFEGRFGALEGQNVTLNFELLTVTAVSEYKNFLKSSAFPIASINRKLSTLRKFCSFCISQGWLKENPAKKVTNALVEQPNAQPTLLENFMNDISLEGDLERSNKIKSDVSDFLSFINL